MPTVMESHALVSIAYYDNDRTDREKYSAAKLARDLKGYPRIIDVGLADDSIGIVLLCQDHENTNTICDDVRAMCREHGAMVGVEFQMFGKV